MAKSAPTSPSQSGKSHAGADQPAAWVARFAGLVKPGGRVLDVAAGGGRHACVFAALGCEVVAVDRSVAALRAADLPASVEIVEADLESGAPWPFEGQRFDAVVVVNYLHRPLLPTLVDAVAPGGILIYETFAQGNDAFGKPSNPDFLLRPGELLDAVRDRLTVVAYEHGRIERPRPAIKQRLCAASTHEPLALPRPPAP